MIKSEVVRVTPEDAKAMLERSHLNTRPLNRRRVNRLANIILNGQWRLTHQGIALDDAGNVLDGKHRLNAVVEAGVAIDIMVTEGVDPDVFAVMDVGKPRTAADALTIGGFSDTSLLGAALRLAYVYEHSTSRPWTAVKIAVAPDDLVRLADVEGERMSHALLPANRIRSRIRGSSSAYAAALFIIDKWAEKHEAEEVFATWLEGLETGVGLETGDARLALASWINGGANLLLASTRTEVVLMAVLRAFHAHIRGENLNKITVRVPTEWFYRLPD